MTIRIASTAEDLKQILQLQAQNHYETLPEGRRHPGGFVTVRHDLDLPWSCPNRSKYSFPY
jgi:hypothetical protein